MLCYILDVDQSKMMDENWTITKINDEAYQMTFGLTIYDDQDSINFRVKCMNI